jgi:hypothetical protein
MLLTKEILVYGKEISIDELALNSHKKVKVKCDNCGKEKTIKYQLYNRSTNNGTSEYYCNKKECINKKRKKAIQDKYGVDNVFQIPNVKDKIKNTNLNKYGVENPQQNVEIKKKTEKTNLKKYGVKNPFQSDEIKEKIKIKNIKKYGTEYPSQNLEFFQKKLKYGLKIKKIENLTYQGSYEKDFILRYKDKITIENGLSIEYYHNDEKKIYHSDFFIPELNLVVEIKSRYWYNEHLEICQLKEKYSKKIYNYIMILDKNYKEFEELLDKKFIVM